jgi:hypothetical protein
MDMLGWGKAHQSGLVETSWSPCPPSLFWGIVGIGLTLPLWVWLVALPVDYCFFNPARARSVLTRIPQLVWHLSLIAGPLMGAPWIGFAWWARRHLHGAWGDQSLYRRAAGVLGAAALPLAVHMRIHLDLYFHSDVRYDGIGLGMIVLLLLWGAYALSPLGYGAGWSVGTALLWVKRRGAKARATQ